MKDCEKSRQWSFWATRNPSVERRVRIRTLTVAVLLSVQASGQISVRARLRGPDAAQVLPIRARWALKGQNLPAAAARAVRDECFDQLEDTAG
jgi:hypothetical protein